VGIGPTKTLAKLANHIAKTANRKSGSYAPELAGSVISGDGIQRVGSVFEATEVRDVWGIGPSISKRLNDAGVCSVADVLKLDLPTLRQQFSVALERTIRELRGISCVELDDAPPARQQIMCSRSFGAPVVELQELVQATTAHIGRVAEKLRAQRSLARQLQVFIRTARSANKTNSTLKRSRFLWRDRRRIPGTVEVRLGGLRKIYRPDYKYAKASVMAMDLRPCAIVQGELDIATGNDSFTRDSDRLMDTVDALNRRFGRGTVASGSARSNTAQRAWQMRQEHRTPCYTTEWSDIALVRA
jgi:DNA polymerase V